MKTILNIAWQTVLIAKGTKLLFAVLATGIGIETLILAGTSLGVDQPLQDTMAIGMVIATATCVILGGIISSQMISVERNNKAIYLTLSLAVSRSAYVIGRFLGVWFILSIVSFSMLVTTSIVTYLLVLFHGLAMPATILPVILLQILEAGVVAAVGTMFAVYSTPTLASLYSVAICFAAHLADDVEKLSRTRKASQMLRDVAKAVIPLFPDLTIFDVRTNVAQNLTINPHIYWVASLYGLAVSGVFLCAAVLIFQRQDLK